MKEFAIDASFKSYGVILLTVTAYCSNIPRTFMMGDSNSLTHCHTIMTHLQVTTKFFYAWSFASSKVPPSI